MRVGLAVLVLAGTLGSAPGFAGTVDRTYHETFAVAEGAKLELLHGDGDVVVRPWDQDVIEVRVEYHLDYRAIGLGPDPDFDVEFERRGNTIVVRGRESGHIGFGFFSTRRQDYVYRIQAPSYVELETVGDDGDLDLSAWRGDLDVRLDDGDLLLDDVRAKRIRIRAEDGDLEGSGLEGRIQIDVADGDVEIEDCAGDVTIRADDGDLTLDGCAGSFELVVADGRVFLDDVAAGRLRVRADDGDVDVGVARAEDLDVEIDVADGDVRLVLGDGIGAEFTVTTDDGRVRLGSDDWIATKSEHRVTGSKPGASEAGSVRIRTEDGDVTID